MINKRKVLILTDSLSLPREISGGSVVKYHETYVFLLRKSNPNIEFIHVGIGGATISQLDSLVKYYVFAEPDLVVIHCGIVDCAPRALSEFELLFFGKIRLLRLILPFTKFLRKYRKLTYTKPKVFLNTLQKIRNSFKNVELITVGILPSCEAYEALAPGITENILKFNKILEEEGNYIDNSDFPRAGIIEDHHHLSSIGQFEIYKKLNAIINEKIDLINKS